MDDRVEVRLHVNFLTSDTYISYDRRSTASWTTILLALEFDCSLLDPGQYFIVFRVGSVSYPVLSSHCGCRVIKLFYRLLTYCEYLKISRPHFKCSFRSRSLAFYVIRECKAKEPKST